MTKSRIFLIIITACIGGVGIASFVRISTATLWSISIVGWIICALGVQRRVYLYAVIGACILFSVVGAVRYNTVASRMADLASFSDRTVDIAGIVITEPRNGERSQIFDLLIDTIDGTSIGDERGVVRIIIEPLPEYRRSDRLRVVGILKYDLARANDQRGGAGLMRYPSVAHIGRMKEGIVVRVLSEIRSSFERRMKEVLPEPHASLLGGILLGLRQSFSSSLRIALQRSGTSHIVAVSGYNMTIVGSMLLAIFSLCAIRRGLAVWLAGFGIVAFAILAGATPSVIRASIMGILALVATGVGRPYYLLNALVSAAAVMIAVEPGLLRFDIGFQLSFAATIGISYSTPSIERSIWRIAGVRRNEALRLKDLSESDHMRFRFARILGECLAAELWVLPFVLWHFGEVSLVSPFANILILWTMPFTMLMGFLSGLFAYISNSLALIPGFMAWITLEYQLRIIGMFSALPFAAVKPPHAPIAIVVVTVLIVRTLHTVFPASFTFGKKEVHNKNNTEECSDGGDRAVEDRV